MTRKIGRTIPQAVKRELRQEVEFGYPVPDCGNPYLEFHHFDPPWAVEKHHDPDRMIALCSTHHAKADAWNPEQVRALKRSPQNRPEVQGRIEWMSHSILAVVGGNFYYETPTILMLNGRRVVWFERDEQHYLLLNISMDAPGEPPRTSLTNNDWTIKGEPRDVISPPNGSQLKVQYPGGDFLEIRFKEYQSFETLSKAYPSIIEFGDEFHFPVVVAQVELRVRKFGLHLHPEKTILPGSNVVQGGILINCEIGLAINAPTGVGDVVGRYAHLLGSESS